MAARSYQVNNSIQLMLRKCSFHGIPGKRAISRIEDNADFLDIRRPKFNFDLDSYRSGTTYFDYFIGSMGVLFGKSSNLCIAALQFDVFIIGNEVSTDQISTIREAIN
jgi:hypothetical protein